MDRFLIAENPMNNEPRQFVIHTISPKCIIEAVEPDADPVSSGFPHQVFSFVNSDGVKETWALVIRDLYDESTVEEQGKLLERAWRWFRSYMEWEDSNIDESEDAQWN